MSLQENSQSNNTKILKTENGENNNEKKKYIKYKGSSRRVIFSK